MNTYLNQHVANDVSPAQTEPLDETQVLNNAGGYTWAVDEFTRLRRFLVLGSQAGTYYQSEKELTEQNLQVVRDCIKSNGVKTVIQIEEISRAGRAAKNDQAILALALCVAEGDEHTKKMALQALPYVCRIGTHLFMFVEFLNKLGHLTGRAKRRALAAWYNDKEIDKLAYQAVKYRQRGGWSHRDVLRVAHPVAVDTEHAALYEWITKGTHVKPLSDIVDGYELAQLSDSESNTAELVRKFKLPREAVKTEHLNSNEVWRALLDEPMGLTALIRNLGVMTKNGLLTPTSDETQQVINRLKDKEGLVKARVHPMNILFALKTYGSGGGWRGNNSWTPVPKIVNALDKAFYASFGNVESTGKRTLIAIDVSGSMTSPIGDTSLMCLEAAAAMAMVTEAVEDRVEVVGFTAANGGWASPFGNKYRGFHADGLTPLRISSEVRLDDNLASMRGLDFGATDCALPMLYAKAKNKQFDSFIIYTDNETWAGNVHPAKALKDYRKASGIDARLAVVGMTSSGFTIADPNDAGMLDVVGFDTATPNILTEFFTGRI